MTIAVQKIRDLPLSAASGLVILGDAMYVIADDALHLHGYSLNDAQHEQRIRLRSGELPLEEKARKKQKPDFEALVHLPPSSQHPQGALFALGSGSKANRQRGVLLPLPADENNVHEVDLAPLYSSLNLDDTNIEGAVVCGEQLVLLQRGNNRHETSALVIVSLASSSPCEVGGVAEGRGGLVADDPSAATQHLPYYAGEAKFASIIPCNLPRISDVPLGFTDGLCLPNGNILFSAVAEDTDDSYNDGACLGAAIGEITLQGELLRCEWFTEPHKIEGIALDATGKHLYAVTDADDPAVPAALLKILLEDWL